MNKIVLLCNVRKITDFNHSDFEKEADYDDIETIEWIKKAIEANWYEVVVVDVNTSDPIKDLLKIESNIFLVFNFTEWDFIPNFLDRLGIPYTWSGTIVQNIIYDKKATKEVLLSKWIPTPDWQVTDSIKFELKESLDFPLIIKPNSKWSSIGITNESVVYDMDSLYKQVDHLLKKFGWYVLIETFLPWKEFSVWMIWNPPIVLPILESNHDDLPSKYQKIDSLEVKWLWEEKKWEDSHLVCPANIDKDLEQKINTLCLYVRDLIWIYDYCRIDLRCDHQWNPYILEINSPAWLIPPTVSITSYLPLMARKYWLDYNDLIKMIIDATISRYNLY